MTQASFNPAAPVNSHAFGTNVDPKIGKRIGGVNVFGGGLALYKAGSAQVTWVSVATRHAPITWSRGGFVTLLGLMSFKGFKASPMRTTRQHHNRHYGEYRRNRRDWPAGWRNDAKALGECRVTSPSALLFVSYVAEQEFGVNHR